MDDRPVTEYELHAWLDGELPAERCEAVRRHLAEHPEDARRLPGIIDAPRNAFVFELTPTMSGRRAARRSVPRSANEAIATEPRGPRRRHSSQN